MKMSKNKKILIALLAIICISIALGAYLNSNNTIDTDMFSEKGNITVNDSITDIANPNENGTVWLEDNGTLKETKVTESTGNGSASS